ncbi:cytochrome c1, heme protein, mitochondrial [Phasianus colchicus]|uniref:cytochrome c1, heme protein, mitochondrial n=1 Tax=Phasianus colchicus TaxID=9054 RepID=UPI00129E6F88|nr:cytochrome c1, heme protein, mitochondrial [Phasianus colchicus]
MAAAVGAAAGRRFPLRPSGRFLLSPRPRPAPQGARPASFSAQPRSRLRLLAALGALTAGGAAAAVALRAAVDAGELELHPPAFPWSHGGPLAALDHDRCGVGGGGGGTEGPPPRPYGIV